MPANPLTDAKQEVLLHDHGDILRTAADIS
jgi:hypothetical protein